MTLHELCDTFGISRRTVQGYEKHGLVRATGRNPRGYLLYDLQMQTEIQKIHQFQKFGFQVKEIGTLMMLSKPELRERLAAQRIIGSYSLSPRYLALLMILAIRALSHTSDRSL